MGLFDALTTAVSGLNAQSFAMQNISGNIANSQTTAYKGIDTSFANLIPGDSVPTRQIAGGVIANSRATNNVQGTIQSTKSTTDMAINGNGYFIVQAPTGFSVTAMNDLGESQSLSQDIAWQADAKGWAISSTAAITTITVTALDLPAAGGNFAVGEFGIANIPAPGALALLGLAGMIGGTRRRRHG